MALLGTGPNQWLAYTEAASPEWAEALGDRLAATAAVVDQSGAYTMLQITGADARRCLQKGLSVDLSPSACPPGTVVVSTIAHIGVIVHHAAPDRFHCFIFRSYTTSFREWLDTTIAAL